jgi:hypothetical protein
MIDRSHERPKEGTMPSIQHAAADHGRTTPTTPSYHPAAGGEWEMVAPVGPSLPRAPESRGDFLADPSVRTPRPMRV